MKFAPLLFFALVGWTFLGAIGIVLSLARNRRAEARKHASWLAAVLGLYVVVLLLLSIVQPRRTIRMGQDRCFDTMCFAVVAAEEVPGFEAGMGDAGRVVRVAIRVSNHGGPATSDDLIRAYLIDARGRRWDPMPGLSGNLLTARVAGGSHILSQPMFRVGSDAGSLGLVFTHGPWQPRRLMLGDSDSLGHRAEVVPLAVVQQAR
jgi:hypothetical protein